MKDNQKKHKFSIMSIRSQLNNIREEQFDLDQTYVYYNGGHIYIFRQKEVASN